MRLKQGNRITGAEQTVCEVNDDLKSNFISPVALITSFEGGGSVTAGVCLFVSKITRIVVNSV